MKQRQSVGVEPMKEKTVESLTEKLAKRLDSTPSDLHTFQERMARLAGYPAKPIRSSTDKGESWRRDRGTLRVFNP